MIKKRDCVLYECSMRRSRAAAQRLGLLIFGGEVLVTNVFEQGEDIRLILQMPPVIELWVKDLLKPCRLGYRSPTRFERGTLIPLYASPEEELDVRND